MWVNGEGKGEGPVPYRSATQMASANGFRNALPDQVRTCRLRGNRHRFSISPQFWIAL